jgi:phosphoribosylformimino-5-aminoimidazole carboxamide ribonucleotide (ProFAR) isomerase
VQLDPALDLRAGRLPRAVGDTDPGRLPRAWRAAGAEWVHVTDLDRAFATGDHTPLVCSLLRAARDAGFAGAIVGRALLEGRCSMEEALACCG